MGKNVIVIGAGLGGLITGALLSKEGYVVTLLEKNPIIGGGLQCFHRRGVIFETGMQLAQMAVAGSGGETCNPQSLEGINEIEGGLPVSMGQSIVCTIDAIQNKILDIMAVGSAALCAGFYLYSWGGIVIFPHLGFVITGLLLWISALLMLIIYPWLLIDCVLQMCIASIMMPVAVGAYAFKYTRKMFVAKVWGTFLEAMFMFIFPTRIADMITKIMRSPVKSAAKSQTNTL